jgi:hypothetical protein
MASLGFELVTCRLVAQLLNYVTAISNFLQLSHGETNEYRDLTYEKKIFAAFN